MRAHFLNLVDLLRRSRAARWTAVRRLRTQTRAVLSECRARRCWGGAAAAPPPTQLVGPAADDWLEGEVLRVIAGHPEGVGALDIGNELGVDWRRVPAAAGRLVEQAIVDQVAHEFYPAKKAS
jgi:hypothetical protein